MYMTNKHMKCCWMSLIVREAQMKITDTTSLFIRMAFVKTQNKSYGGHEGNTCILQLEMKKVCSAWKTIKVVSKIWSTQSSHGPVISLLDIYPNWTGSRPHSSSKEVKEKETQMSISGWTNKTWYTASTPYYSALKRKSYGHYAHSSKSDTKW